MTEGRTENKAPAPQPAPRPAAGGGAASRRKKPGKLFTQLLSYGFVGGSAASIDITCLWLLVHYMDLDYRLANFFSFTVGTFINFLLCNFFIFEKRALSFARACARHYFSSVGGLIVNMTVLILLAELVLGDEGLALFLSKLAATGCSFVFNFTMIRFYAFNSNMSLRGAITRLFSWTRR